MIEEYPQAYLTHAYLSCREDEPLHNAGFNCCPLCTDRVVEKYRQLLKKCDTLGIDTTTPEKSND